MHRPTIAPAFGLRAGEVFNTIPQTVLRSKTMTRTLFLLSRYTLPRTGNPFSRASRSSGARGHTHQRTRLFLEALEERWLPSGVSISVANASLNEISNVSALARISHSCTCARAPELA
jgi:hypothetical protein